MGRRLTVRSAHYLFLLQTTARKGARFRPKVDTEHLPMERLLKVAATEDSIFTLDEFNHLKVCQDCFSEWVDFIKSLPQEDATVRRSFVGSIQSSGHSLRLSLWRSE